MACSKRHHEKVAHCFGRVSVTPQITRVPDTERCFSSLGPFCEPQHLEVFWISWGLFRHLFFPAGHRSISQKVQSFGARLQAIETTAFQFWTPSLEFISHTSVLSALSRLQGQGRWRWHDRSLPAEQHETQWPFGRSIRA